MKVREFIEQARPADWLVDQLIPRYGKTLIAGPQGSAKSWLTESLALAVCSGTDFLGHFRVSDSGPVVIVDQDSSTEGLAERFRALPIELPEDLHIFSHEGIYLDKADGVEALAGWVKAIGPKLVVLETLDSLTSGSFRENRADDLGRLFDALEPIWAANPCALVLTHHFRKGPHADDPAAAIRGSTVLTARVDAIHTVTRAPVETTNQQFVVQPQPKRFKTRSPFLFELVTTDSGGKLDSATLRWVRDMAPDVPLALEGNSQVLLDAIRDRGPEGATINDLLRIGSGYFALLEVKSILRHLEKNQRVNRSREAHGRFRFWVTETIPQVTDAVFNEWETEGEDLEPANWSEL